MASLASSLMKAFRSLFQHEKLLFLHGAVAKPNLRCFSAMQRMQMLDFLALIEKLSTAIDGRWQMAVSAPSKKHPITHIFA